MPSRNTDLFPWPLKLIKMVFMLLKLTETVSVSAVKLFRRMKRFSHPSCADFIYPYRTGDIPTQCCGLLQQQSLWDRFLLLSHSTSSPTATDGRCVTTHLWLLFWCWCYFRFRIINFGSTGSSHAQLTDTLSPRFFYLENANGF